MPLMLSSPHALIEGMIIASYAIRARNAFIYIRGEVLPSSRRLRDAVAEAYDAGLLGTNILGPATTWNCRPRRRGAYISAARRRRCSTPRRPPRPARLRPPFPGRRRTVRQPDRR